MDEIAEYLRVKKIAQVDFARQLGISRSHLNHILAGHYQCSPALALKVCETTKGAVPLFALRPDIYPLHLAQLIGTKAA